MSNLNNKANTREDELTLRFAIRVLIFCEVVFFLQMSFPNRRTVHPLVTSKVCRVFSFCGFPTLYLRHVHTHFMRIFPVVLFCGLAQFLEVTQHQVHFSVFWLDKTVLLAGPQIFISTALLWLQEGPSPAFKEWWISALL